MLYLVFLSTGAVCPDGISEFRNEVICPNEVRLFRCSTINSISIGWSVIELQNKSSVPFRPSDMPGLILFGEPNIMARLESRITPPSSNSGNRTSILFYTPDLDAVENVSIICTSGSVECDRIQVLVYGLDGIDKPSNASINVNEGFINYKWDHAMMNLVDYYLLTLEAPGMEGLPIQVNTMEFSIQYVDRTYSGTVRAVSICGHESDTLYFIESAPAEFVTPSDVVTSTGPKPADSHELYRYAGIFIAGLCGGIMVAVVIAILVHHALYIRGRSNTMPPVNTILMPPIEMKDKNTN